MRRLVLAALLLPLPALAHTGVEHGAGLAAGLAHPLGGADHLMAMVAVGLWAGLLGARAAWALPAAFLTALALGAGLGAGLGAAGGAMPAVEAGVAASIIALGALAALALRPPLAVSLALASLFGLLHGYPHGAEMPEGASPFLYAAGFLVATAGLHGLGLLCGAWRAPHVRILARSAGFAIAAVMFVVLLTG
ncbi:HupE/UreJ family protein [Roseomonas sp. GCM10028921]